MGERFRFDELDIAEEFVTYCHGKGECTFTTTEYRARIDVDTRQTDEDTNIVTSNPVGFLTAGHKPGAFFNSRANCCDTDDGECRYRNISEFQWSKDGKCSYIGRNQDKFKRMFVTMWDIPE